MERRFKLITVNIDIAAPYGADLPKAVKKALPEGSQLITSEEMISAAAIQWLVYNPKFPKLQPKEMPPYMPFEMKEREASPILTFQ